MCKPKERVVTGPRVLPRVQYGPIKYFADLRLREFRDVKNFSNSVKFDSEKGRKICTQTGVVSCPCCGMSAIVSMAFENKTLRCMQCFSTIKPLCSE